MGRKGKQKDYITATEWKDDYGGKQVGREGITRGARLPFNHCALTFKPINPANGDVAVMAPDGAVFNLEALVPYITKYHTHPITGGALELSDVTKIRFSTNPQGEICCPVLGKVFNGNTDIVAVRTSGNVYCREAVEELNLKAKNMRDLLTDEKFVRKDILTIQDPKDLRGKNVSEYDHLRRQRLPEEVVVGGGGLSEASHVNVVSEDAGRVLEAVRKNVSTVIPEERKILYKSEPVRKRYETVSFKPGTVTWNTDDNQASVDTSKKLGGKALPQPYSAELRDTNVTMGGASKSLTSTAVDLSLTNERTKERVYLRPKSGSKGYVRLHTTLGDLNLELHCDLAPKTCENFLALAASGYYDGVPFHRSIRNFMIQGGDPTGTGTGGANVFGTLEDEIHPGLRHDGRGVVSMANSGKDTNGSQFFITYKSAKHLDGKHSILGRVVGGFDVLTKMENVPCDDEDRPREEIRIERCTVFVNPYTDMLEEAANERKREEREERKKRGGGEAGGGDAVHRLDDIMRLAGGGNGGNGGNGGGADRLNSTNHPPGGVGKYLDIDGIAARAEAAPAAAPQQPAKKKAKPLSNFDAW